MKYEYIQKTYGKSEKLSASIAKTLSGGSNIIEQFKCDSPSTSIQIAHQVGSCGFEFGTAWGQKVINHSFFTLSNLKNKADKILLFSFYILLEYKFFYDE